MSAGYDVFIGPAWIQDPQTGVKTDVPFEEQPALDEATVRAWVSTLPDADVDAEEHDLSYDALEVIVYVLTDDAGVLRSVEAEVHGSDGPSFVRDLEDLLERLLDLADRVGARVYSPESDEFVSRENLPRHLAVVDDAD